MSISRYSCHDLRHPLKPVIAQMGVLLFCTLMQMGGAARAEPHSLEVSYMQGAVSASVEGANLERLLAELARAAQFELTSFGELDADASLTVTAAPLAEVLSQLLRDYSFAYQTSGESQQGRIVRLFVFAATGETPATVSVDGSDIGNTSNGASESGPVLEPASAAAAERRLALESTYSLDQSDAVSQLADAASDPDPAVRSAAMAMLAERGGEAAFNAIADGVGDPEPQLRAQAMETLVAMDRQRAYPSVGRVMFGDPDVSLRLKALRLLAQSEDEVSAVLLSAAAQDSVEAVSKLATELAGQ